MLRVRRGHGRVADALALSLAGQGVLRLGSFVGGVVFARLLVPHDFGVFAEASAIVLVLTNVNDLGLTWALMRGTTVSDSEVRTAVTLVWSVSALLFACCWAAAPALASALQAPEAVTVLRVMAVSIIVDGVIAVPTALLMRALQQGRQLTANVIGMLVGTGLTLALAAHGAGAMSLAAGMVAGNAVTGAAVHWLAPARPRPGWRSEDARLLVRFGLPVAATALLGCVLLNADYLIVGRLLGTSAVGIYLLAFNLASWPVTLLTFGVRKVTVPVFGQLPGQHHDVQECFFAAWRGLMTATVAISLPIAVLASPLIKTLYGPRWVAAASLLALLVVLGAARVAIGLADDVLVARGHPRATLCLQAVWLALLVPSLYVGCREFGLRGVAAAHAAVGCTVMALAALVLKRRLQIAVSTLTRTLAVPATAAVIAGAAGALLVHEISGNALQVAAGGLVITATYGLLTFRRTWTRMRPFLVRTGAWS